MSMSQRWSEADLSHELGIADAKLADAEYRIEGLRDEIRWQASVIDEMDAFQTYVENCAPDIVMAWRVTQKITR